MYYYAIQHSLTLKILATFPTMIAAQLAAENYVEQGFRLFKIIRVEAQS